MLNKFFTLPSDFLFLAAIYHHFGPIFGVFTEIFYSTELVESARFTDQDLDDEEIGGRIHWAHPPLMQRVTWDRTKNWKKLTKLIHKLGDFVCVLNIGVGWGEVNCHRFIFDKK